MKATVNYDYNWNVNGVEAYAHDEALLCNKTAFNIRRGNE